MSEQGEIERILNRGDVRPGDVCVRCGKFQPIRIERREPGTRGDS